MWTVVTLERNIFVKTPQLFLVKFSVSDRVFMYFEKFAVSIITDVITESQFLFCTSMLGLNPANIDTNFFFETPTHYSCNHFAISWIIHRLWITIIMCDPKSKIQAILCWNSVVRIEMSISYCRCNNRFSIYIKSLQL